MLRSAAHALDLMAGLIRALAACPALVGALPTSVPGGGPTPLPCPRPSEVPSPPPVYVEAYVVMRAPFPGLGPLLLGSAAILGEWV